MTATLPLSSGFGSSAALCTGVARRMLASRGAAEDPTAVWHLAHELERFFHGTPSGIDTGLTSLGGTRSFHFDPAHPAKLPETQRVTLPDMVLVIGAVPRATTTRDLVAGVRERRDTAPAAYDGILRRLGELSTAAADAVGTDLSGFATLATEAHRLLTELGVSTELLDKLLMAGRDAGAIGGKLSGAGGGAFYCICPDIDVAETVRRAIKKSLPEGGTTFIHSELQLRAPDQTG
jgi:mevalonate kinase